ncbi:hypothetical protein IFM89_009973 [Coptis chinensis]|uniref:Scarecrow-like protein 6 n=1 Tax=Coptis chinensis TaxID=261450 RepID=A0A835HJB6_9MAGN|nr:hypothetical protein IFM89_009973 [Coptis chinensis]
MFNLQGQQGVEFASSLLWKNKEGGGSCFGSSETISVLDQRTSPSSPTSSSSLAGSEYSVGVASVQKKWEWSQQQQHQQQQQQLEEENSALGMVGSELQPIPRALQVGMEDWESVLTEESGASLVQEQSFLGWIMGEVEDPSSGLKHLLQNGGGGGLDFQNTTGFGMVDPSFGFEALGGGGIGGGGKGGSLAASATTAMNLGNNINPPSLVNSSSCFPTDNNNNNNNNCLNIPNSIASPLHSNPSLPVSLLYQQQQFGVADVKTQSFTSTQNQAMFVPFPHNQQIQQFLLPPQQGLPQHMQFLSTRPTMTTKPKLEEEVVQQQNQHQVLVDQLFKAAELVETGNLLNAQGILARLNHQLSPVGKPLLRAAFLFKEALQLLLFTNSNNKGLCPPQRTSTPFDVVHKINAYKTFSEVSPLLHFTNLTCNQAFLEALENYDRIHIVDFDIGFGGQWSSFMQELRMRVGSTPSLKITTFVPPSLYDPTELNLTRENLTQFANEFGIPFEINFVSLDSLNSSSLSLTINAFEGEAVAVNFPVGIPTSLTSSLPLLLRFVKQLSPKIVVSVDRGCDRSDLPFSQYVLHSLQSYSILLESLDAVNVNPDIVHKIEKFYLLPTIERSLLGCQYTPQKMPPWRNLFTSAGFSPITFSNFTETQAEYVLKRLPVRGFHIEKRNSSLMLCWQRRELASVSAWRC